MQAPNQIRKYVELERKNTKIQMQRATATATAKHRIKTHTAREKKMCV